MTLATFEAMTAEDLRALMQDAAETAHEEHRRIGVLTMGMAGGDDDCDACVRQAEDFWSGCE